MYIKASPSFIIVLWCSPLHMFIWKPSFPYNDLCITRFTFALLHIKQQPSIAPNSCENQTRKHNMYSSTPNDQDESLCGFLYILDQDAVINYVLKYKSFLLFIR